MQKQKIVSRIGIILLILCSFSSVYLMYANGTDNEFVADDWSLLHWVSGVDGLSETAVFFNFHTSGFVRPLKFFITWVLFKNFGLEQAYYHSFSFILDFLNTFLLAFFIFLLFQRYKIKVNNLFLPVIIVSILFLFNWRHHEAIYWYSSINELLATFFRFLSLIMVLLILNSEKKLIKGVLISSLSLTFIFALLSKENSIALIVEIFLLVLLDIFENKNLKKNLRVYFCLFIPVFIVSLLWLELYLNTSGTSLPTEVKRNGMQIINTSFINILIRLGKFFNGNFFGTAFISRRLPLLIVELLVILILILGAFIRKKYLWIYSFFWTIVSIFPYIMTISSDVIELEIPIINSGVAADRYLYYSAAGAGLFIVMSILWIEDERKKRFPKTHISNWVLSLTIIIGALFLALNINRIINYESQWDKAGEIGISIANDIVNTIYDPDSGSVLCVGNLPDNYKGKYIYRNGIEGVLYLLYENDDFEIISSIDLMQMDYNEVKFSDDDCTYIYYYNESEILSNLVEMDFQIY